MISKILSALLSASALTFAEPIRFEVLKSSAIHEYKQEFVDLCHTVYAEYPYLYDSGSDEGYEAYICSYGDSDHSVLCLAWDGEKAVGLCSGIPLIESRDSYQGSFLDQGLDVHAYFYLGELILLKEYRGKGIGESLYSHVEAAVKEEGSYSKMTCCNIQVAREDPKMPKDYQYIDYPLWIKLGFKKHLEICYDGVWRDIGDEKESSHHLFFWIKDLEVTNR